MIQKRKYSYQERYISQLSPLPVTQGLQPSRLPPKHMLVCGSGVVLGTFSLFAKNEAKKHVCALCAKHIFLRLKGGGNYVR